MKLLQGLGRQIVFSMVAATMSSVAVAMVGTYLFYGVLLNFAPKLLPATSTWFPSGIEWLVIILVFAAGLALAVRAAVRLAASIVSPLSSVAENARKIAAGDFSARVEPGDPSLGEAAQLVDDFNNMAERLERAATDVIAWNAQIAHELRTPLSILQGRMQGIVDGVFEADDATFRRLLGQVNTLIHIVEDLRVVSLVDSGRFALQLADVDLTAEIEDLGILVEPSLAQAGFTLNMKLDAGMARLDMMRVRQAVMALVDNAQRYADPCALRIELDMRQRGLVELRVVDQGPGLPESFVDRAFGLFSRAEREKQAGSTGSGLGLSVVRAIARAHGGDVTYRRGELESTFVIRIPRFASQALVAAG